MSIDFEGSLETTEERQEVIASLGLPMAAVERFLESRDKRVPSKDNNFYLKSAELLNKGEIQELINQHKYAGRETIHYFIVTGISEFDLDEILEKVRERLPRQEDVEGVTKEPFLAGSDKFGECLYLPVGYYEYAGSEDPITGTKEGVQITKRTVVVINDERDLVEVRGSDDHMVEFILDEVCKSIGKYRNSVKRRPEFGVKFQDKFNELVEFYYNLKVRVDDQENSSLDTISFTSKQDESGERRDARDDERVERELEDHGAQITMGYVELSAGFRFRMNRELSKISFMKSEREENINQINTIIHNVLEDTGEYSHGKISGTEDVPE